MINIIRTLTSELSENEYKEISLGFFKLSIYFTGAIGLNKKILIFLDNNIIQDIKHHQSNKNRQLRYISLLLFIDFLKNNQKLDIEFCICPTILYESHGRRIFKSEKGLKKHCMKIVKMLEVFDLPLSLFNYSNFRQYTIEIKNILKDEQILIKQIRGLSKKNWAIKLKDKGKVKLTFTNAFDYIPNDISLKYFHEFYINFILASYIDELILNTKSNNKEVRKTFSASKKDFPLHNLIKEKNNMLEGLGDIELLQLCDLTRQYSETVKTINTVLTFDKTLYAVMNKRQGLSESYTYIVGKDNVESYAKDVSKMLNNDSAIYQIVEKQDVFFKKSILYLEKFI